MAEDSSALRKVLEDLWITLSGAVQMTRELAANHLFGRLLAAFEAMPVDDRPTIIDAIEREVKARKLSFATEGVSGQSMVANPNARLYLRAHESGFDRNILEREEMTIATMRGMRAATLIPAVPDIYASWQEATREAIESVDEATRTVVEQLVHEVLGFIAEARVAESEAEPSPPATPIATPSDAQGS